MSRTAAAPARRPSPAPSPRVPAHLPGPPANRAVARPLPRGAAVLDALLHGRLCIGLVFALLAGIVFFNVDLLRMNREIARTEERVGGLKRENARLRTDLARLGSSERIQRVAAERGLVLPAPGEVRYLRSRPAADARRAAARIAAGKGASATPEAAAGTTAQPGTPAQPGTTVQPGTTPPE